MGKILLGILSVFLFLRVDAQDLKAVVILGTFNEKEEIEKIDFEYIKIYESKVDYNSWYVQELSRNMSRPDSLRLKDCEILEMSLEEILERKLLTAPPIVLEGRILLRVIAVNKKFFGAYIYDKGKYKCKPHLILKVGDSRLKVNQDLEKARVEFGLDKSFRKKVENIPYKFREADYE